MKIITISGLDGSGKSTQIELLKHYLESQGKRVFYFHAIEFSLTTKIINFRNKYCLICRLTGRCNVTSNEERGVTKSGRFGIILRKIFLRIDIWRFEKLRNKLRNSGHNYILSDRYFYDSVINIEFLNRHPALDAGSSGKSKFNPLDSRFRGNDKIERPDLAFYLQTSPEIIMQRERIPDQGPEYLKKKKELYDAKTNEWNWKVVNGNKDKDAIFEEIKNYV